jgi:hypothetical protein
MRISTAMSLRTRMGMLHRPLMVTDTPTTRSVAIRGSCQRVSRARRQSAVRS